MKLFRWNVVSLFLPAVLSFAVASCGGDEFTVGEPDASVDGAIDGATDGAADSDVADHSNGDHSNTEAVLAFDKETYELEVLDAEHPAPRTVKVTITNRSDRTISSPVNVSLTDAEQPWFGLSGGRGNEFTSEVQCATALSPGASCTVELTFEPADMAGPPEIKANLTAKSDEVETTARVVGILPCLRTIPNAIDFGPHPPSTQGEVEVEVINACTTRTSGTISINAVTEGQTEIFAVGDNGCDGITLTPGGSCTFMAVANLPNRENNSAPLSGKYYVREEGTPSSVIPASAIIEAPPCKGTSFCKGNVLFCNEGSGWKRIVCSGDRPVCNPLVNRCTKCIPGTIECAYDPKQNASTLRKCTASGYRIEETPCGALNVCSAGDGECLDPNRPLRVTDFDLGNLFGCAIVGGGGDKPGEVRCWGSNTWHTVQPVDGGANTQAHKDVALAYWTAQSVPDYSSRPSKLLAYKVSTGRAHACAISNAPQGTDRQVKCWGFNGGGQVGAENTTKPLPGVTLVNLKGRDITDIATGNNVSCAIRGGDIYCWGDCSHGVAGQRCNSPVPKMLAKPSRVGEFVAIEGSPATNLMCALSTNYDLYCWNLGATEPHFVTGDVKLFAVGEPNIVLATKRTNKPRNPYYQYQLRWNATSQAWDVTESEQGTSNRPFADIAAPVPGTNGAVAILQNNAPYPEEINKYYDTAGGTKIESAFGVTCVLTIEGTLRCQGNNLSGACGTGIRVSPAKPTPVAQLSGISETWLGDYASVFKLLDETLAAAGRSRLLFGNLENHLVPQLRNIQLYSTISFLTLHRDYTFKKDDHGDMKFNWHSEASSELAYYIDPQRNLYFKTTYDQSDNPGINTHVCSQGQGFANAYVARYFQMGLCTDGNLLVYNYKDQALEQGLVPTNTAENETVVVMKQVMQVAPPPFYAGHICLITQNRRVYCWGNNRYGQATGRTTKIGVGNKQLVDLNAENAKQVVTTNISSCALTNAGNVWCWGNNSFGQVGVTNTQQLNFYEAQRVSSLKNIKQLAAGAYGVCALDDKGDVYCWGSNGYGQLGDPKFQFGASFTPRKVPSLSKVKRIFAEGERRCALMEDTGALLCWGRNDRLAMGIGSHPKVPVPHVVAGLN